jgi:hypothetical protein
MKVFVFLVCLVLFVGSFALFALAFTFDDGPWQAVTFFAGILAVSLSLIIPFHLLQQTE